MVRFLLDQLRHRRGRAATLGAGILVAAVSFVLLTSAVGTSALQVRGTVAGNWKAAYDILVRPPGSYTPIERQQGLVRDNYLSGIFGGITLRQWQTILSIPGVEVAAPVANIGYIVLRTAVPVPVSEFLNGDPSQLYRIHSEWLADNATSRYPAADTYMYVTGRDQLVLKAGEVREVVPGRAGTLPVCSGFYLSKKDLRSPFDLRNSQAIYCYSTQSHVVDYTYWPSKDDPFPAGQFGVLVPVAIPVLLAAIDPVQEAKLVGLDRSVVSGRFLTEGEVASLVSTPDSKVRVVPLLASTNVFVDETLGASVERLAVPTGTDVPAILASKKAGPFLAQLTGSAVGSQRIPIQPAYQALLQTFSAPPSGFNLLYDSYRTVSPVTYSVDGSDRLAPAVVENPDQIWASKFINGYFPISTDNADVQFRTISAREGSNAIHQGVADLPMLQVTGRFDPSQLQEFSSLSQVPLESYLPPQAQPADATSRDALGCKPLTPTLNVGDYLQQPPLAFTTLQAAQVFEDPAIFKGASQGAPISAIRVRVAGVTGPDPVSRERIRRVAQAIEQQTGLVVDITAGSSPHPLQIQLPAGKFGRPALLLQEGWTKKGVAVAIISALDRKSLTLFVLVLVVSALFLANGAFASVRSRRREIGTLLCLGWSKRNIFRVVLGEMVLIGLIAGLAGTAIAAGLAQALALKSPLVRTLLVAPVAVLVALLAGLVPAWRAARSLPIEAIKPQVSEPRRARAIRGTPRMALFNLLRLPGRTVLGAAALLVGVGALGFLLAVNLSFRGTLVGTLLGQVVSVQVRGVDYLSAGLAIALGGLSVANVLFLNLRERAAELVTLRTIGWRQSQLGRLVSLEGVGIGIVGSVLGGALGVGLGLAVGGPRTQVIEGALLAALIGVAVAALASLVPALLIGRMTPPTVLAEE
jgi:putative ABC transport system permease protein